MPGFFRLGLLLIFAMAHGLSTAHAQELPFDSDVPLPGVTGYAAGIPTPDDVMGHRIGTRHTIPHQVVDYFEAVAAASDRVVYGEHARSYEGRKLVHAIVTSPANHARLEAIRTQNLALSDDPASISDADLSGMPGVVYMGYSVHGNEASGTEAAVLLLYHLAAGEGPAVQAMLDSLVVIIDPMLNPDGRDRFADWANRHRGAAYTSDSQNREHNEAWPGGRTNHYLFDLNRDWLLLQHPESQGRMALWHHWRPQVSTDYHEMGSNSTFFFQPGIPSRTNPNTPSINQELTAEIATYHARILDRVGQLYYTEESFDDFYYGKGSTYPDINGSIGILFEQASSRALVRETDYGTLHYSTTIRNQFMASLSSLEAGVAMREKLLRNMRDFYRNAPDRAEANAVQGYVVGLDRGRTRAQHLAQVFQQHRIRLHLLGTDVTLDGHRFQAGEAYVIPIDQPQTTMVKAIMERTTTFADSLFYDVSSWTLPLAFDVDYAEVRRNIGGLLGDVVEPVMQDGGQLVGGHAAYAYAMPWAPYFAGRALYRLQAAGVRPVLLQEPFSAMVNGQQQAFPRGTVVIPVTQQDTNAEVVHQLIETAVREDHVMVYALNTGLTPGGPDLGSPQSEVLTKPDVVVVSGSGTSSYAVGEAWYLLSERFQIPVSLVDQENVQQVDLGRYTTMILSGGFYGDLEADEVKRWVRQGGRLIVFGSAIDWARDNGLLQIERKPFDMDSLLRDVPYADLNEARGAQFMGGAIFEAQLDTTHPLAYGMPETLPVFLDRRVAYEPSETPGANVARFADEPLLSGYVASSFLPDLAESAALVTESMGGGRVIAFNFNPDFRAYWYGTDRLVLNAVLLGGAF